LAYIVLRLVLAIEDLLKLNISYFRCVLVCLRIIKK
jgi:hypothetical protein